MSAVVLPSFLQSRAIPELPGRTVKSDTLVQHIFSFDWCCPSIALHIKRFFGQLSPLAKQLDELCSDLKKWNHDTHLKIIGEAFESNEFTRLKPQLAKILLEVPDEARNQILKHLFKEFSASGGIKLVERLRKVFEVQKTDVVAKAIKAEFPDFANERDAAIQRADVTRRRYEMSSQEQRHTLVKTAAMYALHTFDWFINMLMQVLHLKDTTQDDADGMESHLESEMRFQGLIEELQLFSGWLLALYLLVGSLALTILITAVTIATIATIGVIYIKWFKPPPEEIRSWTNLTKLAILGKLNPVFGRDAEVNAIIQQLVSNKSSAKRHIFLTGPTGVGKNEIINLLAIKIVAGDVPAELKGDFLYQTHISDLLSSGGDKPQRWHLDKMQTILKNHRNSILSFDEGKVAFMNSKNLSKIGEKLKQTMDFFESCIITMTDQEYDRYITDPAIIRRTVRLQVKTLDDAYNKLAIEEMAVREAPDLKVTDAAIQLAADVSKREEFKNCSQPFTSKDIMARAFARSRLPKNEKIEKELAELKLQRDTLETNHARKHGRELLPHTQANIDYHEQLKKLYEKISEKEAIIKAANDNLGQYLEQIKLRNEFENMNNIHAMQIQNKMQDTQEALQQFVTQLYYQLPALDDKIHDKAKELKDITTEISKEMIEQIINEKIQEMQDLAKRQQEAKHLEEEESRNNYHKLMELLVEVLNGKANPHRS